MFGSRKDKGLKHTSREVPEKDPVVTKPQTNQLDSYDWHEHIVNLAKAQEPDIRVKADDLLVQYTKEYNTQKEGFSFSCRRFGDFLTIELTRDGNREASLNPHSAAEVHHAETFNLSKINSVRLEHGHGPDLNGEVRFSFYQQAVGGGSTYSSSSDMFFDPPIDGYEYKVDAHGEGKRYFRPIIHKESTHSQNHHVYHGYNNSVSFVVDNYPRSSKDDNIHLIGIETSIPVPFGLGQDVLDQILAEIERGSTRDPIVIST